MRRRRIRGGHFAAAMGAGGAGVAVAEHAGHQEMGCGRNEKRLGSIIEEQPGRGTLAGLERGRGKIFLLAAEDMKTGRQSAEIWKRRGRVLAGGRTGVGKENQRFSLAGPNAPGH